MRSLEDIRLELDSIDNNMVELFDNRMKLCEEVARYKIQNHMKVLDRSREKQKLDAVGEKADSEFNRTCIREVYRQIMAMSRKLQNNIIAEETEHGGEFEGIEKLKTDNITVVFQGMEGSYSQAALKQYFEENVKTFHVDTFKQAFESIEEGKALYAVLPMENSSSGAVHQVFDLLMAHDAYIVDEIYLPVKHALAVVPGTELSDISKVFSHPQGLLQCSGYLEQHREWQQIGIDNTAFAAMKIAKDKDKSQAAICSEYAAGIHGLEILKKELNQEEDNTTRFVIISNRKIYRKQAEKICICFEILHESGSLYRMLSNFIYNNINMTKIESRPVKGKKFEYSFFVEFEGNLGDSNVQSTLTSIREESARFKILGNY